MEDQEVKLPKKRSWLEFFKRKPTTYNESDSESESKPRRLFLGLPLRWLLVALVTFLLSVIIVCAVVITQLRHSKPPKDHLSSPPASGSRPFREVLEANFPDPALFKHNNTWYAFATNNAAGVLHQPMNKTVEDFGKANVQLATSQDFQNWTLHNYTTDPLPTLGDWVAAGVVDKKTNNTDPRNQTASVPRSNVWAPDLIQRPLDGKFVLYYSATAANATGSHCVGASIADAPEGPYKPLAKTIACPTLLGGAIDPAPFVDVDGKIYVAYKVDGNNRGHGGECGNTVQPLVNTPILLQRMDEDAVTPVGAPIDILDRTKQDGPLVEAPTMVRTDEGVYFLFFSSGCTRLPSYDLKYATSKNITGPYTRAKIPLLKTGDWGLQAPGSVSVRRDEEAEKWRLAFHARVATPFGGVRAMYTANLLLNGTTVTWDRS